MVRTNVYDLDRRPLDYRGMSSAARQHDDQARLGIRIIQRNGQHARLGPETALEDFTNIAMMYQEDLRTEQDPEARGVAKVYRDAMMRQARHEEQRMKEAERRRAHEQAKREQERQERERERQRDKAKAREDDREARSYQHRRSSKGRRQGHRGTEAQRCVLFIALFVTNDLATGRVLLPSRSREVALAQISSTQNSEKAVSNIFRIFQAVYVHVEGSKGQHNRWQQLWPV